jgi:hypothetical protein
VVALNVLTIGTVEDQSNSGEDVGLFLTIGNVTSINRSSRGRVKRSLTDAGAPKKRLASCMQPTVSSLIFGPNSGMRGRGARL